ncbi:MAG TPA: heavy metal-binding domain-containing protein [Polyangiaceae bacterium]
MPLGRQNIDLEDSLRRLMQGGLPTRASLRLAEEAGPHRKLFTSDLSVNEFLLTSEVGAQPISQVMGSSIYHIGKIADYKGATGEVTSISDAHRQARLLALSRIFLEAQAVGADAVIGVRLAERMITMGAHGKGGDDGDEVIEFTVVGTAVRAPWITHPKLQPIITDLTGQDLWALARDGYEPCGFLFDFCRYHVWHVMKSGGWTRGGELDSATSAVEKARHLVADRVIAQARKFSSEFVVGSDIKVEVREVPCGYAGCELNDMDVDIVWFGTGVRRIPDFKPPTHANIPPLVLSMMPLGKRRRGDTFEDEDEADEIAKQAREVEERAAEAEEGESE